MIYFDTADLAKCYLNEGGSDQVRAVASQSPRIACCAFGQIELAATIHRNLREGKITLPQCRILFAQINLDEENRVWSWLQITPDLISKTIAKFRILKSSTYLRTADAVHLACASEYGFKEIYSNDRHLLAAAASFKIKGINIIR